MGGFQAEIGHRWAEPGGYRDVTKFKQGVGTFPEQHVQLVSEVT